MYSFKTKLWVYVRWSFQIYTVAFIETQVESYDGCGSYTVYSIEWKKGVVLYWIGLDSFSERKKVKVKISIRENHFNVVDHWKIPKCRNHMNSFDSLILKMWSVIALEK